MSMAPIYCADDVHHLISKIQNEADDDLAESEVVRRALRSFELDNDDDEDEEEQQTETSVENVWG